MAEEQLFRKAILEALFWWQRSECRYSTEMKKAFDRYQNTGEFEVYAKSSFYNFSNDYSIRRTLKGKGKQPVIAFIKECFSPDGLMEGLLTKKNKGFAIKNFIDRIQVNEELSDGNKLTSLISKTAFLFMPESLPLYDQLTKKALEKEYGRKIDSFPIYLECFEHQKLKWTDIIQIHIEEQLYLTTLFPEFDGIQDLRGFLIHRTIDKILWIKGKGEF